MTETTLVEMPIIGDDDTLDFQFKEAGDGSLKIVVRSREECPECGAPFVIEKRFRCCVTVNHRGKKEVKKAERVFLLLSGVRGEPYGRMRIYSDLEGNALAPNNVYALKERIDQEVRAKTFVSQKYKPRNKRKFLFANYKQKYLTKMEWRASLAPGEDQWLARGSLSNIKKAHKYLAHFDDVDIQDICTPMVQDFIDDLNVSRHTKRRLVGHLTHLLRWALARGDINFPPVMPVVKSTWKKKQGQTADQQGDILDHVTGMDRLILRWAKETGQRINEYRAVRLCDLDPRRGVGAVNGAFDEEVYKPYPKMEEHVGAEYPLTDELREIIDLALAGRDVIGVNDYLFVRPTRRRELVPYTDSVLRKMFALARKAAGYPSVTLNTFGRHSMGWQLRDAGAPIDAIADVLGNDPLTAHKNYSHMNSVRKAEVLRMRKGVKKKGDAPGMPLGKKNGL